MSSKVDTSLTLFGKKLDYPIYISVTGGKNCFVRGGEQETAYGAAAANSMMITNGGIDSVSGQGRDPKSGFSSLLLPICAPRARWSTSPTSSRIKAAPPSL